MRSSIAKISLSTACAALLMAGLYWWLSEPRQQAVRNIEQGYLPDREQLQALVNQRLDPAQQQLGASDMDTEDIIDQQAMAAKLAGLTRTVTLSRAPTERELEDFFARHREDYREASGFGFTLISFPFAQFGGTAADRARRAMENLNTDSHGSATEYTQQQLYLTTLELDERYGAGFGDKLVELIADDPLTNLPCWSQPVSSKIGAHLLCIERATLGAIPQLQEIRSQVINDWRYWISEQQIP
jgi:hypothetical protein